MGKGGGGIGSCAPVAPIENTNMTVSVIDDPVIYRKPSLKSSSSMMNRANSHHPPVGLVNVGNTCYANAALQCLLCSALSHALLDPASAQIFRRYSSNPDLLSLGSGSVDSEDDEPPLSSEILVNHLPPHSRYLRKSDQSSTENSNGDEIDENRKKRREQRRIRKKKQREVREKLLSQETCNWITSELTNITRLYTAASTVYYEQQRLNKNGLNSNNHSKQWGSLLQIFTPSTAGGNSEGPIVDPGGITRKVHKISPCLRPYQQEDAHEFLRSLLSTLTLDGHNKKLSSLFDGLLESAVTCQTCHRASITRDRYMDLSLDIQDDHIDTLLGALQHFTQTELMDEENKVHCVRCKKKRVVSKGLRLATAPSILVCHLKRFAFDKYGRTLRLKKHLDYPVRLEIGDFMSRVNQGKPPPYELIGVLVHAGLSCDRGHYYAIVKSGDAWYKVNDGIVSRVDLETALRQQAYILIYEVEGMRANHGFDGFKRYHHHNNSNSSRSHHRESKNRSKKGLARTDESISSYSRNTDATITNESVSSSSKCNPSVQAAQSRVSALLDSILNLCGSGSVAETVRDAICDSDRKKGVKKSKKCARDEHSYLKRALPVSSTTSSDSRLSKHSHRRDAHPKNLHSNTQRTSTSTSNSVQRLSSSSSQKYGSTNGTNFLKANIPLQQGLRNDDETDLSSLCVDSQFIKSVSSNNLLEKKEEVAFAYEKEYFGDLVRSEKRLAKAHGSRSRTPMRGKPEEVGRSTRHRSKSSQPFVGSARVKAKSCRRDKEIDEVVLLEDQNGQSVVQDRIRWSNRQFASAPRAGMRSWECKQVDHTLPPLPRKKS